MALQARLVNNQPPHPRTIPLGKRARLSVSQFAYSGYSPLDDASLAKLLLSLSPQRLRSLSIAGCSNLTDKSIHTLIATHPSLRAVNLSWCSWVTTAAFATLSKGLTALEDLNLANSTISPALINNMKLMSSLTCLSLSGCRMEQQSAAGCAAGNASPPPRSLAAISCLQALTRLDVSSSAVLDADLRQWASLEKLAHMNLGGCEDITTAGMKAALQPHLRTSLTHLDLSDSPNIKPRVLCECTRLKSLILKGCLKLEDQDLRALSGLLALEVLDVQSCLDVGDEGVRALHRLTNLRDLSLHTCMQVTDGGLVPLAALRKLNLRFTQISSVGLSVVALNSSAITSLDLGWCENVGDAGARALHPLKKLQSLSLQRCSVTDAGVSALAGFKGMKHLDLSRNKDVTAAGLHALRLMVDLNYLNVSECVLLQDVAMEVLARLPTLNTVGLRHCSLISDTGLSVLSEATSLTDIDVQGCASLTDDSMIILARLPELAILDIGYLESVTEKGLSSLRESSSLRQVRVRGCSNIGSLTFHASPDSFKAKHLDSSDSAHVYATDHVVLT
eukprot:CAMPEP_0114305348 /NCGR_PEP_ID=MMETSP0059-20121206/16291_1 /TAXON_ID=36894 /ORGANISM="Pyramimonas parkeae, Strain CCMP726" /LENGTH=561 /DNA_ID=CAMNT_0001428545 /DNA_START=41 /DNA_END=1727 /DNA_ORIENTATION=-